MLRQERRYAQAWLRRTARLAQQLHEEMLELAPTEQVGWERPSCTLGIMVRCSWVRERLSLGMPAACPVGNGIQMAAMLTPCLHATCHFGMPCTKQVSAPERVGGHEYYVQQLPGAPHPCYMRRAVGRPGAAPEVVLDLNELAAVHGEYVQVGQVRRADESPESWSGAWRAVVQQIPSLAALRHARWLRVCPQPSPCKP